MDPAMLGLKMLDDRRRFHEWAAIVEQERELAERPVPLQFLEILLMIGFQDPIFERRFVGPESDQHLLRIAAEGVSEELEAHQVPSAIAACRSSSRSLGGVVT